MSVDRNELHELIEQLPDHQIASAADELRRRLPAATQSQDWPPEFFDIIDGKDAPTNMAENVDYYLAAYGFGRDSL